MADHLTDEEQLQQLKNWWKENGTSLIVAVLVGLIAYFGFQWWQSHQQRQAEQASALYSQLLDSIEVANQQPLSDEQKSTASYLVDQLQEGYKSSQYAVNASLFLAKISVDDQNLDNAVTQLSWAIEHADDHIKDLATLRLARVYFAQEKYDDALALISLDNDSAFLSLNAELNGDILLAKNDKEGAQKAYQQAIDSLGESASFRRNLLPIKLASITAEE